MPLRPPTRLPKSFNRTAGSYARRVAVRYGKHERFAKRRGAAVNRIARHWSKLLTELIRAARFWLIVLVVCVLLTGGIVALFSPVFNVRQIQIRRQDARIDVEQLERKLTSLFESRLPFVTNAQIQQLVQEAYPDIRSITLDKQYPSTLVISVFLDPVIAEVLIEEPGPGLAGSGALAAFAGSGAHAYLTSKGTLVFSPIALRSQHPQIIRVTDWGVTPTERTTLIAPEALRTVFQARDTLQESFGLDVSGIVFYLRAQEFHLKTGKVWLWFDLDSPLTVQFERFREFLKTLSLDQVKQYIDLRISDRVIFQ